MMIAELNSEGRNRPNRTHTRRASPGLAAVNRNPPRLGSSVRLPVTPENRLRLRKLREAELRAWNHTPRTSANTALRTEVRHAAQHSRRELRVFAAIVLTTGVAVTLGVLASIRFVEQHSEFVAFVRQLLGLA